MEEEKIPIKFHLDGNKIIFDEPINMLIRDELIIDECIDENGILHCNGVYLKRGILSVIDVNQS